MTALTIHEAVDQLANAAEEAWSRDDLLVRLAEQLDVPVGDLVERAGDELLGRLDEE